MGNLSYDTIVIGAGPAGSRTAALIAALGFRVLLLEKRERIGYPVRCAEAIGPSAAIGRFIELDESLISSTINGIKIVAPGGEAFQAAMPGIGFTLDRERFDRWLAETASEAGALVRTHHQAMGLMRENGRICGVLVKEIATGNEYEAACKVVVGADGIESLSPRWAGIKSAFRLDEIFSCAQELIEGSEISGDHIEFHFGSAYAPGGYAWVFPKGEGKANVGVGINPVRAGGRSALEFLDSFIAHRCPSGSRRRLVVGACEVARGLKRLVTDGFVAVGEAAHQNNPFSGGGIMNALEAAGMAARAITEALRSGATSAAALSSYEREWNRSVGKANETFYRVARIFYGLTDEEMNRILVRFTRTPGVIDRSGVNPRKLMHMLISAHPVLFWRYASSLLAGWTMHRGPIR
jgi:digeranylgeranylglycerophospholipid reductase